MPKSHFFGRNPAEDVRSMGCTFSVYRRRKREKVVTISFWKARPGYIFNLSQSIVLWPTMIQSFFGDEWNIRMYVDYTLLRALPEGDVAAWDDVMDTLLKWDNVELWLFECGGFRQRTLRSRNKTMNGRHRGTFASIVRFQPLFDPSVTVWVSRNLELLTSCQDAANCRAFAADDTKRYLLYNISGYNCHYGDEICKKTVGSTPFAENMLIAWFGCKDTLPERSWTDWVEWTRDRGIYEAQAYGIDEIFLWKMFKPNITPTNTMAVNVMMGLVSMFADIPDAYMQQPTTTDDGKRIQSINDIVRQFAAPLFEDKSFGTLCEYYLVDIDEPEYTARETPKNKYVLDHLRKRKYIDVTQDNELFESFLERLDGCPQVTGRFLQCIHDQIRPRTGAETAFVAEARRMINTDIVRSIIDNREVRYFHELIVDFPASACVSVSVPRQYQLLQYANTQHSMQVTSDLPGIAFKDKSLTRDRAFRNKRAFTRLVQNPRSVCWDRADQVDRETGVYEVLDEIVLWEMFETTITSTTTPAVTAMMRLTSLFADIPDTYMQQPTTTDDGKHIQSINDIIRQFAAPLFVDESFKTLGEYDRPAYTDRKTLESKHVLDHLRKREYIDVTRNSAHLLSFLERLDGCPQMTGKFLQCIQDQIRPRTVAETAFVAEARRMISTDIVSSIIETREVRYFDELSVDFPAGTCDSISVPRQYQLLQYANTHYILHLTSGLPGFAPHDKSVLREPVFMNKRAFTRLLQPRYDIRSSGLRTLLV